MWVVGVNFLPFGAIALGVHQADGRIIGACLALVVVLLDGPFLGRLSSFGHTDASIVRESPIDEKENLEGILASPRCSSFSDRTPPSSTMLPSPSFARPALRPLRQDYGRTGVV